MAGGDIKDQREIESPRSHKASRGFRDKGNAIHHVTVNATHASPSGSIQLSTHSNFIRPHNTGTAAVKGLLFSYLVKHLHI